ncbi:MAG: HAMP domain-containing histidine kinase [Clostridia bacterium]|nr:HAMP domain-containing histidine kinase [Clostridia bacterium]
MSRKEAKAVGKKTGIHWTLFAYLAVFCVAVLVLIWVVQVFLLDRIYYQVTLRRMDQAGEAVAAICGQEGAFEGAEALSVSYDMGIAVFYDLGDTLGERFLWAEGNMASALSKMKNTEFEALYQKAREEGGYATRHYEGRYELPPPHAEEYKDAHAVRSTRIVCARLTENADGIAVVVFLDAATVPIGAAENTVIVEIVILSVILILAALCLAHQMSRRIAKPIARVTEGAKALATGHYDIRFESGGYREIEELSSTLNYAAEELSKVDSMQKELIANISHDLRTPLTTIIGYAEIMRDIEGENKPENVQVIIDEAKRLSELVNDLLQLSRYQAGGAELHTDIFDMDTTVTETVERYRQMMGGRGYTFTLRGEGTALAVQADRGMILQVLYNLINNAVNYAGEDKEITLTYRRAADGYIRIEVIDRGEGIPADKLPHIWQRYYKVDAQHKRSVVGSGLGLSIVRGILEAHLARYGVDSRVGEGSTFWFELPPYIPTEIVE